MPGTSCLTADDAKTTTTPIGDAFATLWRPGALMAGLLLLAALFFRVPRFASSPVACEVFRWPLTIGILTAYLWGYRLLRAMPGASGQRRAIVGFAAAFVSLALLILPFQDIDVDCYINFGWVQAHYERNPYCCTINSIPEWDQDPMFHPYWEFIPSPYGFLFSLLSKHLCQLGHGNWWLTLFLFRAVNVVSFGLLGWVVWACSRRLSLPHPERILYLLLWNPLLLVTGIVQAHNDILMALFTTLAIFCALGRGWPLVMPALVAATLVKHLTGPILPLAFLLLGRRHGWGKAVFSTALGLLLGAALSGPYVGESQGFLMARNLANVTDMHNSLAATVGYTFEVVRKHVPLLAIPQARVVDGIKLVGWSLFGIYYAALALRWLRDRTCSETTLLRDLVLLHFVVVCLVSSKFYPWYMGMFLAPALLLPSTQGLRRAVLAVSCGQVLSLTFVDHAHFLNVLVMLLLPLAAARYLKGGLRLPWEPNTQGHDQKASLGLGRAA